MEGTLASNLRMASMGGVAARHLSRDTSEVIGFIGAGEQARMHLLSMKMVRPGLKKCRVAAPLSEVELSRNQYPGMRTRQTFSIWNACYCVPESVSNRP
jgi:ornithine cyclodeaminase/alanine dehydrogenase-like protein (mu-crystallin family)